MEQNALLSKPVRLFTGKYGILLLTTLNVCLACLIVTLTGHWSFLHSAFGNADFMTYYLLDYRVGFVSRALIGSILYLFTEHPTLRMVTNMLLVMVFLSLLLFAFLQAQLVRRALRKFDYATLLASYLFFLNSIFWCDAFEFFGLLDIFMTVLLQVYLLCAEQSRTLGYILAPIVCFAGMLIHTAFFFSCFPVVGAILWFDLLQRGKPGFVRFSLFGLACAVSVVLFVVFVFFTQEMARVNMYEMMAMIKQKYDGPIIEEYHTVYLFRHSQEHPELTEDNFLSFIFNYSRTDYTSFKIKKQMWNILPLTAALLGGCAYHAHTSGNRKIAYLGFLAPFVALFPALDSSTDKERFFSLCILAQYMLLHFLATQTDDPLFPRIAPVDHPDPAADNTIQIRNKRIRLVLIACAAAGLAHTVIGILKL